MATPFLVPMTLGPLGEPAKAATLVVGAMMLGRVGGFLLLPRMLKRWGGPRTLRAAGFALGAAVSDPRGASVDDVGAGDARGAAGVVYACWEMTTWLQVLRAHASRMGGRAT